MAKTKINGMEMFVTQLDRLTNDITKINRGALGSAAGFAADEMKAALRGLPVHDDDEYGTEQYKLYGATQSEKDQIIDNFGISTFRTDGGTIQTSIGFTGYVETPSTKFNDHVPTGMLMQAIEYGTSFRTGTHTIGKIEKRLRDEATQKAQDYIDQQVDNIMN